MSTTRKAMPRTSVKEVPAEDVARDGVRLEAALGAADPEIAADGLHLDVAADRGHAHVAGNALHRGLGVGPFCGQVGRDGVRLERGAVRHANGRAHLGAAPDGDPEARAAVDLDAELAAGQRDARLLDGALAAGV